MDKLETFRAVVCRIAAAGDLGFQGLVLAIKEFLPRAQLHYLAEVSRNKEAREELRETIETLAGRIAACPQTYEQDGKGDQAIAHLHYFAPSADWWITERDSNPDGEGQIQAFGLATINGCEPELGYISIKELCACRGVELDFYFTPCTLKTLNKERV